MRNDKNYEIRVIDLVREKNDEGRDFRLYIRRNVAPDILNWLVLVKNVNQYIRCLIREDMQNRIEAGVIDVNSKTGEVTILKPQYIDMEMLGTVCSEWNCEPLPGGVTIWDLHPYGKIE